MIRGEPLSSSSRSRWRRRLRVLIGLALAWWIIRVGWSLWPPSWPGWPAWRVLTGVTVINPGQDRRADQTILMRDGRIESIHDRSPDERLLPRALAFEHRYILPGLIDVDVQGLPANVTLQRMFGVEFLMRGVTTIRDTGNFGGSLAALQARIEAGEFPWPRLGI